MSIDYVAAVDPITFNPKEHVDGPLLLAIAGRVGSTRLIDNTIVERPAAEPPIKAILTDVVQEVGRLGVEREAEGRGPRHGVTSVRGCNVMLTMAGERGWRGMLHSAENL